MDWFKRHLNWTAFIITLGGLLLAVVVFLWAHGFNWIIRPYLLASEIKVYLGLAVLLSALLSITCMLWVIRQKNLPLPHLLWFIPAGLWSVAFWLAFYPGFLFNQRFFNSYSFSYFNALILLIPVAGIFWLIGLVIVLALKKRPAKNPESIPAVQSENTRQQKTFPVSSQKNRVFLGVGTGLLAASVIIAAISGIRINAGHLQSFNDNMADPSIQYRQYAQFEFECPASYLPVSAVDVGIYPGAVLNLNKDRLKPFYLESTLIIIGILPPLKQGETPVYSSLLEQCFSYNIATGSYDRKNSLDSANIDDLRIEGITVNGISAELASFHIKTKYSYTIRPAMPENVRLVCFERDGFLWTIRLEATEDNLNEAEADFENLIKSFKFL